MELASEFLNQMNFKKRSKIQDHMLSVILKSAHECVVQNSSQPRQIINI